MIIEKVQDNVSSLSYKEESKIDYSKQDDKITVSSLESQQPKLKRSLKARHLAVNIFNSLSHKIKPNKQTSR
jgi:lysine-specific permease